MPKRPFSLTASALIEALALAGFLAVLFFAPSRALGEVVNAEVKAMELANEVMSPFCPGRTLSACPSGSAVELREQIEQWLVDGKSEAEVRAELINLYGNDVLGRPDAAGFGLVAWIAPAAFVLLGFFAVYVVVRRPESADAGAEPVSDEARRAVEEELQQRLQA